MIERKSCLCGSLSPYEICCGVFHSGESLPPTAEALMRARFCAFAMRNEGYLLDTWDPEKRPAQVDFNQDTLEWTRLEIVARKKGGEQDPKGIVEFKAYYRQGGEEYVLREISRFRRARGRWYYLDGAVKSIAKPGQPAGEGRNAPCPCGSGKKFKRCCGKDS